MHPRTTPMRAALLAALLLAGDVTQATSSSNSESDACTPETPSNCLNGVTNAVTSIDALRVTTGQASTRARDEATTEQTTAAALNPAGTTGLAAGDGWGGWGFWASYNYSDFESEFRIAPYDANLDSYTLGVDRLLGERFVLGVSLGYEETDSRTFFNGGGQETDGVLVAPYAAWLINDVFSLDVSGGYTSLDTDQNRIDPTSGGTLFANFDADRYFVAGNLNALRSFGNLVVGIRGGVLYTEEDQDGYKERGGPRARIVRGRTLDLTQASIGGDLAYAFGAIEPYVLLNYRNDLSRDDGSNAGGLPVTTGATHPDDDDEVEFALGLRYFGDTGVSAGVEWLQTLGRQDFDNHSLMLTLRLDL